MAHERNDDPCQLEAHNGRRPGARGLRQRPRRLPRRRVGRFEPGQGLSIGSASASAGRRGGTSGNGWQRTTTSGQAAAAGLPAAQVHVAHLEADSLPPGPCQTLTRESSGTWTREEGRLDITAPRKGVWGRGHPPCHGSAHGAITSVRGRRCRIVAPGLWPATRSGHSEVRRSTRVMKPKLSR